MFNTQAINTPENLVYCDFETQSAMNLKKVGPKVYIEHPTTRIMSAVFMRGKQIVVWCPADRLPRVGVLGTFKRDSALIAVNNSHRLPARVAEWAKRYTFVAHNAELFDAWLYAEKCKDEPQPKWLDTIHLARSAGLPGRLDGLLKVVVGHGKADDTAMKLLTEAKIAPGGRVVYPVGTMPLWRKLIEYNIDDVLELDKVCEYIRGCGSTIEHDTIATHARINARGYKINRNRVLQLRECWQRAQAESVSEIEEITGGAITCREVKGQLKYDVKSGKKVREWLESKGFYLPGDSLDSRSVNQILENPQYYTHGMSEEDGTAVIAMLAERQNAVRATVGKLDTILAEVDHADSCIRRSLVYFGAHTGRFSGRAIQPHNFPRGKDLSKSPGLAELLQTATIDLPLVKAVARANKCRVSDVLATLTRSVIVARDGCYLAPFDYAAVEARGVAWIANATGMLKIFADPHADVYCDMASKLFGKTVTKKDNPKGRFVGKQIVLGCGYQMGAPKFALSCQMFLVDLEGAGTTAEECVRAYRKAYPEIPKLWRALDKAAKDAICNPGRVYPAGRCRFVCESDWLCVYLPSGRVLRYRSPELYKKVAPWDQLQTVEGIAYINPHGAPKDLYGGKLAENIVQAISRDLLCHAMNMIDANPATPIVLHVHDEIVPEIAERNFRQRADAIGKIVSKPPKWASGFPLMVEGFLGRDYTKGPVEGEKATEYLDGRRVVR